MGYQKGLVIKLSGSVLDSWNKSLDIDYLRHFGKFIASLSKTWLIAITIGGGNLARLYISAAKELGLSDTRASILGGDAGLLNCRLLLASLANNGVSVTTSPIETWDLAQEHMNAGHVPVLYGRWPALTSDSVAVYFADYASMNLIVKLSQVDAIYNKDPNLNDDAKPIRYLSHDKLEEMAISMDSRISGSHFIFDLLAARRLKNSNLPLLVLHKNRLELATKLLNQPDWGNLSEGTLVGVPKNEESQSL